VATLCAAAVTTVAEGQPVENDRPDLASRGSKKKAE